VSQGGQGASQPQQQIANCVAERANQSNADSKGGSSDAAGIPAKFKKLMNDMNLVKGNINFTNEIIDQTEPAEKSDTLDDLHRTLA